MSYRHMQLVVEHSKTRGPDRAILLVLALRADEKTGACWPSLNRIASDAGLTRRCVYNRLPHIEAAREIHIERRQHEARTPGGAQHLNRYVITLQGREPHSLPLPGKVGNHVPKGREPRAPKVGNSVPKGREQRSPKSTENLNPESTLNGRGCPPAGVPRPKSFKQWTESDLRESCTEANAGQAIMPAAEAEAFFSYWSEPTATGRPRMTLEKSWDTNRRMHTWQRRAAERRHSSGAPQPARRKSLEEIKAEIAREAAAQSGGTI